MSENSHYLQPAFILNQRKFKETSLIIDALTRDFGRISLLAKGVRKTKSKSASLLQVFNPLSVSFFGNHELKTLTAVELIPPAIQLNGLAFYCGFYVNELLLSFLHKYDPHPELFFHYSDCLNSLSIGSEIEQALRIFEINLMTEVGYGLDFFTESPVESLKKYRFNTESGFTEAEDGLVSGATILALASRQFTDPKVLTETKILMRTVINSHLQGKPLKSREIINNFIKYTKND